MGTFFCVCLSCFLFSDGVWRVLCRWSESSNAGIEGRNDALLWFGFTGITGNVVNLRGNLLELSLEEEDIEWRYLWSKWGN